MPPLQSSTGNKGINHVLHHRCEVYILGCPGAERNCDQRFSSRNLKWRHVQHTASVQTLQVGDVNGHALNIYRLPGMVFSLMEAPARLLYLARQMSLMVLGQLTAT
jgi:hypothetical protein